MHSKQEKRDRALIDIDSSLGTNESGVIEKNFDGQILAEDAEEMAELVLQILSEEDSS